jgi:hypothetical protein
MSNIFEEARNLIKEKEEREQAERDYQKAILERSLKDQVYKALEVLGAPNPRLNRDLKRIDEQYPLFEAEWEGIIVRNASSQYSNLIILEEKATRRQTQVNLEDGNSTASIRQNWLKRIASELRGKG